MAEAIRTGQPYRTRLDPPPADPRLAHPPRDVVAPLRERVEIGRAAMYTQILLHTWNKPVAREVLEAGLVLMLNDFTRQRILGGQAEDLAAVTGQQAESIRGMDQFLAGLVANRTIAQQTIGDRQAFEIGPNAVAFDTLPEDDRRRGAEAVQAVEAVGESRLSAVFAVEAAHAEYELVS